jgi:hypothetical protein
MFWALDEYRDGGTYKDSRGYYNTPNSNAWDNPVFRDPGSTESQMPSIMASGDSPGGLLYTAYQANVSSPTSLQMIGWRDSDGDGIFDVLDVPHHLEGSGYHDELDRVYHFVGFSTVQSLANANPYWSNPRSDVTINEINRIEYRFDGGDWQAAAVHDDYEVPIDLEFPVPGDADVVEIRTVDGTTGVASPVFSGSLSTPTSLFGPGIQGFVWHDLSGNGFWDAGEHGLAGVTLQLADESGQLLDLRKILEPDDYANDTVPLNNVLPGVQLKAVGPGLDDQFVVSAQSKVAGGGRVFANSGSTLFGGCRDVCEEWTSQMRQLRMDFTDPVSAISLDALGISGGEYGRIEIYNDANEMLGRYTTNRLGAGELATMTLSRATADIAYAVAFGHANTSVRLDNLRFGPEVETTTNSLGGYSFTGLPAGEYRVRVSPRVGNEVTHPSNSLHVVQVESLETIDGINFGIEITGPTWQNPVNRYDVDDDGHVTPIDVLHIVNDINVRGARQLSDFQSGPPFLDVSGDGCVAPDDALLIINGLNFGIEGEGEGRKCGGSGGGATDGGEGEALDPARLSEPAQPGHDVVSTDGHSSASEVDVRLVDHAAQPLRNGGIVASSNAQEPSGATRREFPPSRWVFDGPKHERLALEIDEGTVRRGEVEGETQGLKGDGLLDAHLADTVMAMISDEETGCDLDALSVDGWSS